MVLLVAVLLLLFGGFYLGSNYILFAAADKTDAKDQTVKFGEKVLSFETLDRAETFGDLAKYGLVAPEQRNHKSGKNLILLAIKANAFRKGDWVAALGLLGTEMLDVDLLHRIGYKSLFLSLYALQGFKMHASDLANNNSLLLDVGTRLPEKSIKSIIARREGAIFALSEQLEARYIYNDAGNFNRNYLPEPGRKSNSALKEAVLIGLKVYQELLTMNFTDKTLRDTLCVGRASLDYDRVNVESADIYKLGPLQVCTDALKATLTRMNNKNNHSFDFLVELGWEMLSRGLAAHDAIFLPDDRNNYEAMIKVFEKDIE